MNSRPVLPVMLKPLEPVLELTTATAGSFSTILAACCCSREMASKEISGEPCVTAKSSPVSSVGKKPLGTTVNR